MESESKKSHGYQVGRNSLFCGSFNCCCCVGTWSGSLVNDLETFGLLFETLCIRDLRVYADAIDGNVYHYRDKNGLECDAVIHLRNGAYGLIEIKLGGATAIEKGVSTLLSLASKIDTTKMNLHHF